MPLSSLDHSVIRRGSEAYKQCNEGGVECGAHSWVCVCTCVCLHTRVCSLIPLPPNNSKPQRSVGEACLKPKLRRTATSLLWPFPRQAWPFIYNKFQPRPLDKGGQTRRSCSEQWASQKAGRRCPRRYFRNVNGMPEWRASEPRARAENCSVAICWGPGSLIATASQEWCLFFFFF